jgi:hypothetical protein
MAKIAFKDFRKYLFDAQYKSNRVVVSVRFSEIMNAILAVGKIAVGIVSLSLFACVNGLYNAGVAFSKHFTLKNDRKSTEQDYCRRVGLIIILTSLIYLVYCVYMVSWDKSNVDYGLIGGLTIATFAFTEIGMAVYGIIKARHTKDITLRVAKRINLVTALIAIVFTESALLGMSGVESAVAYSGWTGTIVGTVSLIIGLQVVFFMSRKVNS